MDVLHMSNNNLFGIGIVLFIIAIAAFGGFKNTQNANLSTSSGTEISTTTKTSQESIEQQIQDAQNQINDLKKQIQAQEDAKTNSPYKSSIHLEFVNRSSDPHQEYVVIQMDSNATTSADITGWKITSENSGQTATIPTGSILFFAGNVSNSDHVSLVPGDTLDLVTGTSPNGASFRLNKCSGYLSQSQTFIPYISTSCPAPGSEDLSSIPKLGINDACLDYIKYMPSCRTQTDPLPVNWSYECTNFIYTKINYSSCVNIHKNDSDFYQHEWRVYLKRSESLWKMSHESIVLLDAQGKIVDRTTY